MDGPIIDGKFRVVGEENTPIKQPFFAPAAEIKERCIYVFSRVLITAVVVTVVTVVKVKLTHFLLGHY